MIASTGSVNFNQVTVGESSLQQFTIFNSAAYSITVSLLSSNIKFVLNTASVIIPANGQTNINVTFTPDAETAFSGNITLHNQTVVEPDVVISTSGTGIKAIIEVSPISLDFGYIAVQDTKNIQISIRNTSLNAILKVTNITSTNSMFSASVTSFTLNPGQRRDLNIVLHPISTLPADISVQNATLTIANTSSNNPSFLISATGNIEIPTFTIVPTSLSYGDVTIHDSKSLNVILTNTSVHDINILISDVHTTSITIPNPFAETVSTFKLVKGFALNIPVRFAPIGAGAMSGQLIIQDNSTQPTHTINLSGTGRVAPKISASTDFINYGKVALGTEITKSLIILNSGVANLLVSPITITPLGKFTILPVNATVLPSQSFEFLIKYTPTTPSADSAKISFSSNDPDTPILDVHASGEGATPIIVFDPTTLDFGKTQINVPTQKSLTIKNSGEVPLKITNISLPLGSSYSITETFPIIINAQGQKIVLVTFNPTVVGSNNSTLTVTSNDYNHLTSTVNLKGEGLNPSVGISPTLINFGNVKVGQTSTKNIVIANTGQVNLIVSQISSSNPKFSVNAASLLIFPNESATLQVIYSPNAIELDATVISFVCLNLPLVIVNATGSGTQPTISVDITPIDFGNAVVGTTKSLDFSIGNAGQVDLVVNFTSPANFSANPGSLTVPPSSNAKTILTFSPQAQTAYAGLLGISSNDPNTPLVQVTLNGTGISAPKIVVNPLSLSFGDVTVNGSKSIPFVIANSGTANLIFSCSSSRTDFQLSISSGTLFPAAQQTIVVSAIPKSTGDITGAITITSNDTITGTVSITLSANGTAGKLQWQSTVIKMPDWVTTPAQKISDLLSQISSVLNVLSGILDIIKIFIIDLTDPLKIIIEQIKKLVTDLINDIASTGVYLFAVYPDKLIDRMNSDNYPYYFTGTKISLLPEDLPFLPASIKKKYEVQIRSRVKEVTADKEDWNLILPNTKDPLSNIKGGSKAFINKVAISFSDPSDPKRPKFSSKATAGALVLAVDVNAGDLMKILKVLKQLANLWNPNFLIQVDPPQNLNTIGGNKTVRVTFSLNEGSLANAYLVFKSTTQGGDPLFWDVPDSTDSTKSVKLPRLDKSGNQVTSYKFTKAITFNEMIAEIFKVTTEEASSWYKNAAGYLSGLLSNIGQAFDLNFFVDDPNVVNDITYYYVVYSAYTTNSDIPSSELNSKFANTSTDQFIEVAQPKGGFKREVNTWDLGAMIGLPSAEISGTPISVFKAVKGSLARCRFFRCNFFISEIVTAIVKDVTQVFKLKHKPVFSTLEIKIKRKVTERLNTGQISETYAEYQIPVGGNIYWDEKDTIKFTNTNILIVNDEITFTYSYIKEPEKAQIGFLAGEKNSNSAPEVHSNVKMNDVFSLNNDPIIPSTMVIRSSGRTLLNGVDYQILDSINGSIKSLSSVTLNFEVSYEYYKNYKTNDNFDCVNPTYNKQYFDMGKCDSGTTACQGYKNKNCFFNNGRECTNDGTSTRSIWIKDTTLPQDKQLVQVSENIAFTKFWNGMYCQNGAMEERCDGYSEVLPRSGVKAPPNWHSITIGELFFDDLKALLDIMLNILDSLLAGTDKTTQAILNFINMIQKKIQNLNDTITKIKNVTDMIANNFNFGGVYMLDIPMNVGGNEYIKQSIQTAEKGPSSDAMGFTGGLVVVYGYPSIEDFYDEAASLKYDGKLSDAEKAALQASYQALVIAANATKKALDLLF